MYVQHKYHTSFVLTMQVQYSENIVLDDALQLSIEPCLPIIWMGKTHFVMGRRIFKINRYC